MALSFISGNPRINLGSLATLSGSAALTVAGWTKLAGSSGDATIAFRGQAFTSEAPWILWRDAVASISGRTNTLAALVNTDIGLLRVEAANNLLNNTEWRHVAMVFEANKSDGLRLYVDGTRDANIQSTAGHTSLAVDLADVTMGVDSALHAFAGDMAEVSFWSTALGDHLITNLAQGFSPLAIPYVWGNLVSYQSLLGGLNRSSFGPVATASGALSHAPHPPSMRPASASLATSHVRSLLAGPYRSVSGESNTSRTAAGATFHSGADQGALAPTGEVNS